VSPRSTLPFIINRSEPDTVTILILGRRGDPHCKAVGDILRSRDHSVVDCDLERYPADIKIATSIDRKGVQRSHLTVEDKAYRLDGFNAIWDRSQAYTKVVEPVRLGMQAYIDAEARTFLDGLYYCAPQSFWLSAPPAARIAEIKVRQLQVAASLGLLIPDSCIGNARAPAHDLTRKYNVMAIKPLFRNVIEYEPSPWQKIERLLYEYRNRAVLEKVRHSNSIAHDHIRFKVQQRLPTRQFVREDAEPFFRSLPPCPVFLQEYVKKKLELRIVVVGGRVFSCAIRSQDGADDARVDTHAVSCVGVVRDIRIVLRGATLRAGPLTPRESSVRFDRHATVLQRLVG
jgi:hypothetical protein